MQGRLAINSPPLLVTLLNTSAASHFPLLWQVASTALHRYLHSSALSKRGGQTAKIGRLLVPGHWWRIINIFAKPAGHWLPLVFDLILFCLCVCVCVCVFLFYLILICLSFCSSLGTLWGMYICCLLKDKIIIHVYTLTHTHTHKHTHTHAHTHTHTHTQTQTFSSKVEPVDLSPR